MRGEGTCLTATRVSMTDQIQHNAVFFDGTSSRKHIVDVRLAAGLEIVEDGTLLATWPYDTIRRADSTGATLRLSSTYAPPLARLEIAGPMLKQAVVARCPGLDAARGPRQTWRIVSWSLAAAASIVLMSLYGIPLLAERIAPIVPQGVEQRMGEAVDAQLRFIVEGKVCENAEGRAAFVKMVDKLQRAGGVAQRYDAQVLSSAIPNAFALPGGKIYLFDGLLQKANGPDEIAGVVAHELGHIQHRDSLKKVMRTGGTSFLFGLLFGDVLGGGAVIFASRSVIDAAYSRDAENAADEFAIRAMRNLGRSPQPMGELLVRVTGSSGRTANSIFASHPLSDERLKRMRTEAPPAAGPDILTPREWQALKNICKTP